MKRKRYSEEKIIAILKEHIAESKGAESDEIGSGTGILRGYPRFSVSMTLPRRGSVR